MVNMFLLYEIKKKVFILDWTVVLIRYTAAMCRSHKASFNAKYSFPVVFCSLLPMLLLFVVRTTESYSVRHCKLCSLVSNCSHF